MVGGQDRGLALQVGPVRGGVVAPGLLAGAVMGALFAALVAVALDVRAGTGGAGRSGQR